MCQFFDDLRFVCLNSYFSDDWKNIFDDDECDTDHFLIDLIDLIDVLVFDWQFKYATNHHSTEKETTEL